MNRYGADRAHLLGSSWRRRSPFPEAVEDLLSGVWPIRTGKGFRIAAEGAEKIWCGKRLMLERRDSRAPSHPTLGHIDVDVQDRLRAGAVLANTSSFCARGKVVLFQHFFHFAHEFGRKKRFFQNLSSVHDQFTQFGKFVGKASDE